MTGPCFIPGGADALYVRFWGASGPYARGLGTLGQRCTAKSGCGSGTCYTYST
jgi:hypothetical protein